VSETSVRNEKFSDNGELIYEFNDEFLVVCPKCASMAKVLRAEIGSEKLNEKLFAPRKLICFGCTYRREWQGGQLSIGGNFDWYFRLPLWLQIDCCGSETLWAYDKKHLNFIENYVAARLRERRPNVNKSLASRLPQWIKSAKNRDEILRAIGKLKEKLNGKS
jgi:hypothetical protein